MMNYRIKNTVKVIATVVIFLFSTLNISAQIKAMAAPVKMKEAIKNTFPTKPSIKKDSTNIYEEMFNDASDDLMENHPAGDIYNNVWVNEHVDPYDVSLSSLPDTVRISLKGFVMPVRQYHVSSKFGPRRYRFHYGIDLALNVGDSILSAFEGKVRIVGYDRGGYGNFIVIRHSNGLETVYGHLSRTNVRKNQNVRAGQLIAYGGSTGRSTGPHLHFETRYLGNAINPASMIDFYDKEVIASTYLLTKKKNFYKQQRNQSSQIAKYVKVKSGDSLSTIANRNGLSVTQLKSLNGLRNNAIQAGKRLRIR